MMAAVFTIDASFGGVGTGACSSAVGGVGIPGAAPVGASVRITPPDTSSPPVVGEGA
jgi:hypothetical protein